MGNVAGLSLDITEVNETIRLVGFTGSIGIASVLTGANLSFLPLINDSDCATCVPYRMARTFV